MSGRGALTLGQRGWLGARERGCARGPARFPTKKEVVDYGAGGVKLGGQDTGCGTLV